MGKDCIRLWQFNVKVTSRKAGEYTVGVLVLSLPGELLEKYGVKEGDKVYLSVVDNGYRGFIVWLGDKEPPVPSVARRVYRSKEKPPHIYVNKRLADYIGVGRGTCFTAKDVTRKYGRPAIFLRVVEEKEP